MRPAEEAERSFEQRLEEELSARQERRLSAFDPEPLAWLALAPTWSRRLAERLELPVEDLDTWLGDLERTGWIQQDRRRDDVGFWMLNRRRAEVLEGLRRRLGQDELPSLARDLGYRLQGVEGIPPSLGRWAELARHLGKGPEEAADWLETRLRDELRDGRSAALRDWIQAGEMLAFAFPSSLGPVVDLGRRRLELLYRRQSDRRHLERFLEREEQITAFERLIEGKEGVWALHYLGMGGVGKTTLIRHLCSQKAPSLGIKMARVDFDHLSPDFPLKRPAQLLLELASDLYLQADDTHLFQILEDRELSLEEGLAEGPESGANPLANLERRDFLRLESTFIDILQRSGPVVLLLDTCEELAKVHASGVVRPSLLATFEIVERLHRAVPDLRVIFAGRRLLTRQGAGWSAVAAEAEEDGGYLPSAKPYLALHRILGFTREEAESLLSRADGEEEQPLAIPLRRAILHRSRGTGGGPFPEASGESSPSSEERFNPFDLALYADWAREDPTLDAATIASGDTDPYVQLRIVDRIRLPSLHRALPGVALLGRFEARDLWPLFPEDEDEDFEATVRELGDQEWIERQRDKALGTLLLEVNRHLLPRLVTYLGTGERAGQMASARIRLGKALYERIMETPVKQVGYDLLNNSLRLTDEKAQLGIWRRIEGAFPGGGIDAAWALAVCERLLAEGGAVESLAHPLRAAVRALHLAAQGYLGQRFEHRRGWYEVMERAEQHPLETMREVLRIRGLAGQLTSFGVDPEELPEHQLVGRFFRALGSHLGNGNAVAVRVLPAQVAALDALLDRAEDDPALRDLLDSAARAFWGREPPPVSTHTEGALAVALGLWAEAATRKGCSRTAASFASLLAARVAKGKRSEALFEQAWQRIPRHASAGMADWIPPESLGDRIRLERYWRFLPNDGTEVYENWLQEVLRRKKGLVSLDGDRLASASLLGWLRHEVVPEEWLRRLEREEEQASISVSDPRRLAVVHRRTPSLITALTKAWLALGEEEHAWRLVSNRLREARSRSLGLATVQTLERAQLLCMLESRRWHQGRELVSYAASADSVELRGLAWEVLVLLGPPGSRELPSLTKLAFGKIRERWPTVCLLGSQALEEACRYFVGILGRSLEHESDPTGRLDIYLALEELRLAFLVAAPELKRRAPTLAPPSDLLETVDDSLKTPAIRRSLRARALRAYPGTPRWVGVVAAPAADLYRLVRELGDRRLAELAQQEGQLLAKRLPLAGRDLLDLAAESFLDAKDPLGAFRCGALAFMAEYQGGERPSQERLESRIRQPYEALRKQKVFRARWSLVRQFVDSTRDSRREQQNFGEDYRRNGFLHRLFAVVSLSEEMAGENAERFWDLLHDVYRGGDFPLELDGRYRLELQEDRKEEIAHRFLSAWSELAEQLGGPSPPEEPVREDVREEEGPERGLGLGRGSYGSGESLGVGGTWDSTWDKNGKDLPPPPEAEPKLRIENVSNEPFRPYTPVQAHLALHAGGVTTDFGTTEPLEATEPYRGWSRVLPSAEKLWGRARMRIETPGIALDVDSSLAGFPWEAFGGLVLGELPDFYRNDGQSSGPGYDLAAVGNREARSPSVFVVGEEPALEVAHGVWKTDAEEIETSSTPFAGSRVREARPAVLHLIGHAAERGGRYRLQLGAEAEGLVEPEEYPLDDIPLVLIQGPPPDSLDAGRTSTDRSQAAELRQVAASFFRQGASVVLMVPSTPTPVVSRALQAVARGCLRPAFELAPWLQIARDLRRSFRPSYEEDLRGLRHVWKFSTKDETTLELALEITLFVRLDKAIGSVIGSTS